jgi:hypothetical protein
MASGRAERERELRVRVRLPRINARRPPAAPKLSRSSLPSAINEPHSSASFICLVKEGWSETNPEDHLVRDEPRFMSRKRV